MNNTNNIINNIIDNDDNNDKNLLLNIRKLCNEINNLTEKIENVNELTNKNIVQKNIQKEIIEKEIIEKKYKILKIAKKPQKNKKYEKIAGTPSNKQKMDINTINWKNSLRNPYFL